jgi:hypothetical protein
MSNIPNSVMPRATSQTPVQRPRVRRFVSNIARLATYPSLVMLSLGVMALERLSLEFERGWMEADG